MDCAGPPPKTKSGNQYLLTIMCASTRFREAIPLRNIKAKTIVKALTKFFHSSRTSEVNSVRSRVKFHVRLISGSHV